MTNQPALRKKRQYLKVGGSMDAAMAAVLSVLNKIISLEKEERTKLRTFFLLSSDLEKVELNTAAHFGLPQGGDMHPVWALTIVGSLASDPAHSITYWLHWK